METKATFAIAEVKSAETDNPNGEFEVVMSTESVDRDGEVIVKGAFDPLPESVPVHAFHDFSDPIGRAVPSYTQDGRLVGRGHFASTARAQEMRQLVADGVIRHTSVGFMAAKRVAPDDGGPTEIRQAELLEVSFVSVPSNREAAVLAVKQANAKSSDGTFAVGERVQVTIDPPHTPGQSAGTVVEIGGTAYGIVFDDMPEMGIHRWYTANELSPVGEPAGSTYDAPESPGMDMSDMAMPGKSPASDVVTAARIRARAALLAVS